MYIESLYTPLVLALFAAAFLLLCSLTLGVQECSEDYCSCPVCEYVFMCVHSNLLPHTLESQKGDTNGMNEFIAMQESFKLLPIFLKMLCSEVMA